MQIFENSGPTNHKALILPYNIIGRI